MRESSGTLPGSRRDGVIRSGRVRRAAPGRRRTLWESTSPHPDRSTKRRAHPEGWAQQMCWQRRTLPPGRPGSTIRAAELNDRVRDGNGCILCAKTTSNKRRGRKTGLEQTKGREKKRQTSRGSNSCPSVCQFEVRKEKNWSSLSGD